MIKCPKTGCEISTGIRMDQSIFNTMPVFFCRTRCPICRTEHEWFARNAWVRELAAQSEQSTKLNRINRPLPNVAMRAPKLMAVTAVFVAFAIAAGFVAESIAVGASPVSGSGIGTANSATHIATTYAHAIPEVNRATKGDRLPVLIYDDQGGAAREQARKDWSNRYVQNRRPREGVGKALAHCEPVASQIAHPEILDLPPRRCFSWIKSPRQYSLGHFAAQRFLTGSV
jgi:hypothetical protein